MKVLKFFLVIWLGSALIGFIVNPMVGTYILFLPTMPFVEMSNTSAYNARVQKKREFILEHSSLLTKEEGIRAAKRICNLEHLDKHKNDGSSYSEWAKPFCELEEDDKIYFYKDCGGCDSADINSHTTGYVLVRDEEPIANAYIENSPEGKWNKYLPIIEQLH